VARNARRVQLLCDVGGAFQVLIRRCLLQACGESYELQFQVFENFVAAATVRFDTGSFERDLHEGFGSHFNPVEVSYHKPLEHFCEWPSLACINGDMSFGRFGASTGMVTTLRPGRFPRVPFDAAGGSSACDVLAEVSSRCRLSRMTSPYADMSTIFVF